MSKNKTLITLSLLVFIVIVVYMALAAAEQKEVTVKVVRNLNYCQVPGNNQQTLDLYTPQTFFHTQKLPLIIWIHGGAWQIGDKEDAFPDLFVRDGYAFASINYRLTNQAKFPAQIEDCQAAVRFLRAHANEYQIDPNRIGVFGQSAGGHLVALLGTTGDQKAFGGGSNKNVSSKVEAVCDWCGITDFNTIAAQAGPSYRLASAVHKLFGGVDTADLKAQASPVTYVASGNLPPFLIMHGDQDLIVPEAQSEELYQCLKKANADVQFEVVKGAPHQFFNRDTALRVDRFFNEKLKILPTEHN